MGYGCNYRLASSGSAENNSSETSCVSRILFDKLHFDTTNDGLSINSTKIFVILFQPFPRVWGTWYEKGLVGVLHSPRMTIFQSILP